MAGTWRATVQGLSDDTTKTALTRRCVGPVGAALAKEQGDKLKSKDEIVAALEKLGTRIDAISGVETAAFIDLKRLSDAMKGEAARR